MLQYKPVFAGLILVFGGRRLDLNPVDFLIGINQKVVRQVVTERLGDVEALLEGTVGKELLSGSPYCFGGEDLRPCNFSYSPSGISANQPC